ncbi:MAG: hypothetical protein JNK78_12375 [Planctomycetes bacterium]|nr:hypothetical protein [Planctomycetota bacterium]
MNVAAGPSLGARCAAAVLVAVLGTRLVGQDLPPAQPAQPATPPQNPGLLPGQLPTAGPQGQLPVVGRGTAAGPGRVDRPPPNPNDSTWTQLTTPSFAGFPVFPSRLSGYGGYPRSSAAPGLGPVVPRLLASAAPEPPGWPKWARLRDREALPFGPDAALLVRNADRVWWRSEPDAAFVPLFFHDKIVPVRAGAEVQVRHVGEFELLFHDGGRWIALGPADLHIAQMTETEVVGELRSFTRLRLHGSQRAHTLVLPDGSRLRMPPTPLAPAPGSVDAKAALPLPLPPPMLALLGGTAQESADPGGPGFVLLDRADEPGWLGGRLSLFNPGPREVTVTGPLGETKVAPGHRIWLFLRPSEAPVPAGVAAGDAVAALDGAAMRLQAAVDTTVSWCGARIRLSAGCAARFQPIQGRPFDSPATSRPKLP